MLLSVFGVAIIFLVMTVSAYRGLTAQIASLEERTQTPQSARSEVFGLPNPDMFRMFEKSDLQF